mmetsp:Transcript_19276/g.53470  ORF Transcript_19276/g.53470 Transcript_19276/m.53470 type:complete len:188 (+) Transcript_19276:602-1165(+)
MYNEPGLGYGASYGSAGHAVVERAAADATVAAAATTSSTQLYDTYHPGVCDPMPGWKVTWNPPDCNTQTTPDVRGLMPPAAWSQTSPSEALAPPAALATAEAVTAPKAARPSPGHLILCGHAALFGAASATAGLVQGLFSGEGKEEQPLERWAREFRTTTAEAAAAVTPVGAFVLKNHVLGKEEATA